VRTEYHSSCGGTLREDEKASSKLDRLVLVAAEGGRKRNNGGTIQQRAKVNISHLHWEN
jgi:hypothetical protein